MALLSSDDRYDDPAPWVSFIIYLCVGCVCQYGHTTNVIVLWFLFFSFLRLFVLLRHSLVISCQYLMYSNLAGPGTWSQFSYFCCQLYCRNAGGSELRTSGLCNKYLIYYTTSTTTLVSFNITSLNSFQS